MVLDKRIKILIGVGTGWLVIFPGVFAAGWMIMMMGMAFVPIILRDRFSPSMLLLLIIPFALIFIFEFLTIAIQFVLMAFYLIHVIKNTAASETLRIIFGVGNYFLPYISMPIYYYLFIWRDRPPDWALAPMSPPANNMQAKAA